VVTMYQIWFRNTATGKVWLRTDQIDAELSPNGYMLWKACMLAEQIGRQFPEDEIAILPVGIIPCEPVKETPQARRQ
jgi:hypothetical protein